MATVDALFRLGVTTEEYARKTFEEANPEIFKAEELTERQEVSLKYNSDDRPKAVIENFVAIMENDSHYSGIKFNEISNRAEVHVVDNGKLTIEPWSDADEANRHRSGRKSSLAMQSRG